MTDRPLFSSAEAVAWTGAQPHGALPESFVAVSTDSRTLLPGALFVALRGERFEGKDFLAAAAAAGAGAALVAGAPGQAPAGLPLLEVADTLAGLGALAHGYRATLAPVVVAVTGSVGKTSTKELLAAALAPLGPVLATAGNLNNEIGLPLTLFRLRAAHRVAVLEMGMNHLGEIARLAAIARPQIGVVLNARGVHLETLGSLENVARAKGELFFGLPPEGIAVVNADDPLVRHQAQAAGRRALTFGEGPADVRLVSVDDRGLAGIDFRAHADGRTLGGHLRLLGAHNALNACAAVAGALAAGVALEAAVEALSEAQPAVHRLQVVQLAEGVTLLDDCYNASPSSMRSALQTLRAGGAGRRLGAILGDMLELGPRELALHREIGEACGGLAWLVCVGRRARALAEGAESVGVPVSTAEDVGEAWPLIAAALRPGDAVLLKASRGMRLERIGAQLGAPAGEEH